MTIVNNFKALFSVKCINSSLKTIKGYIDTDIAYQFYGQIL